MVKAYLKYVQHDILGGLVSNTANLETCMVTCSGAKKGPYLVSGHNELVFLTSVATNEIEYKIYDKGAANGFVTCLKVSGGLMAIGYSSGTIVVVDLDLVNGTKDEDDESKQLFGQAHKFHFHRTAVTCILFDHSNTTMYSGSQDTYIVTYDLVAD
jgi:WD40 repeat protein